MDIQLGATSTSYMRSTSGLATRSADSLTLYLPAAGPHDLYVTFADGSQQIVAGVAGGDYAVGTGLNRAVIASIVAKAP